MNKTTTNQRKGAKLTSLRKATADTNYQLFARKKPYFANSTLSK